MTRVKLELFFKEGKSKFTQMTGVKGTNLTIKIFMMPKKLKFASSLSK